MNAILEDSIDTIRSINETDTGGEHFDIVRLMVNQIDRQRHIFSDNDSDNRTKPSRTFKTDELQEELEQKGSLGGCEGYKSGNLEKDYSMWSRIAVCENRYCGYS